MNSSQIALMQAYQTQQQGYVEPITQLTETPHRYWRFLIDVASVGARNASTTNSLSLSKFTAASSLGGTNLLTNANTTVTATTNATATKGNLFDANDSTVWAPSSTATFTTLAPFILTTDFGVGVTNYVKTLTFKSATDAVPECVSVQYSDNGTTWVDLWMGVRGSDYVSATDYTFSRPNTLLTAGVYQGAWVGTTSFAMRTSGLGAANYHGMGRVQLLTSGNVDISSATATNISAPNFLDGAYAPSYLLNPAVDGVGGGQFVSGADVQGTIVRWDYPSTIAKPAKLRMTGYNFNGSQGGRDYADYVGVLGLSPHATGNSFWTACRWSVPQYLADSRINDITIA